MYFAIYLFPSNSFTNVLSRSYAEIRIILVPLIFYIFRGLPRIVLLRAKFQYPPHGPATGLIQCAYRYTYCSFLAFSYSLHRPKSFSIACRLLHQFRCYSGSKNIRIHFLAYFRTSVLDDTVLLI